MSRSPYHPELALARFLPSIQHARRLNAAGVPCELEVVPGATHGFDQMFARTDVVKDFWQQQVSALRRAGFAAN